MKKKRVSTHAKKTPAPTIENKKEAIVNGLSEALFGFNPNNILGFNPGSIGTQLNQVDTFQINCRWYLISNFRQLLSEIYVEHGIIQTIVDVPVDDGFRGGIEIKTKQLEPEEIEKLHQAMEEHDDITHVMEAHKWNRLFGGAGVIAITDQDPSTELDIDAIKPGSPLEFRGVDLWELFWTKQNTSDYSAAIDQQDLEDVDYYDYYGVQVHKSRVNKLIGLKAPSFIRPRLRGWGFSVCEILVNSLNQYLKSNNLIFEVLDEFKVDVYKIKNLTNSLLSPQGTQQIQRRIQLANQQKNYQNAISMDAEDDFIQKELSFAGIAETMNGIRMQVASDLRMPLTKVFGISAAGFNSGEDDIENYNSMIESTIRHKAKKTVLFATKLRCQNVFGFIPDDLEVKFKPMRTMTSEQEENVKTQKFNRLLACKQAGEMTTEEFKDACNKENLLGIQVDTSIETLAPVGSEDGEVAAPEAKKPKKPVTEPKAAKNELRNGLMELE